MLSMSRIYLDLEQPNVNLGELNVDLYLDLSKSLKMLYVDHWRGRYLNLDEDLEILGLDFLNDSFLE